MIGARTDVLGVVAVAIGAAAVIYALMHLARKAGLSPASWLLPAGIGAAMIVYSVWNDYAWYGRALARLPAGSIVLIEGRDSQPWAPWTYLAPPVVRFAALDPATVMQDIDGIRNARITLVERRGETLIVPQDFDCAARLIRPARSDWAAASPDDPAFAAVCAGN